MNPGIEDLQKEVVDILFGLPLKEMGIHEPL
jgi:hypothetical protein